MSRTPVLNKLTEGLSSMYISRGGTPEQRDIIVESIVERQRLIEKPNSGYPMLAVFAEGTTTNSTVLFPFKRGAFQAMKPVVPSFVTYETGQVRPIYDCASLLWLSVMIFASLQWNKVTLNAMPEFRPNQHMLDRHRDKGGDDWQVFAWCVRDAISRQSGLRKEEGNSLTLKKAYLDLM